MYTIAKVYKYTYLDVMYTFTKTNKKDVKVFHQEVLEVVDDTDLGFLCSKNKLQNGLYFLFLNFYSIECFGACRKSCETKLYSIDTEI